MRTIYIPIAHFAISCAKFGTIRKNWEICRAPWEKLLGTGPRNFAHIGFSWVSDELKNLGALDEILGDIRGVPKFFRPPYTKTNTQIRNFISKFERARQCASTIKFIGKSIRRKFVN